MVDEKLREKLDCADAMRCWIYQTLLERNERDQETTSLIMLLDGLSHEIGVLSWAERLDASAVALEEMGLDQDMANALDLIPQASWLLSAYDLYPGRGNREARLAGLRDAALGALMALPAEDRWAVITSVPTA